MCDKQYRNHKGRFAKKKNVDKVKKCLKAMTAAKVKEESSCSSTDSCISNLEGKRIIDIKVFSKNLKCKSCSNLLDLEKISKERVVAQASIFTISCEKCKIVNDVCTRHNKNDHDCRKNFEGSVKAMEADVGADFVVIGDEDSSTIAAIRKSNPNTIYKLADHGHLIKNIGKDLYDVAKSSKELKKKV
ncbi:hypothetical protein PV327_008807 [Microctonus hyperodae]|uniref:Mutator-like transposase domain-containing protein n=1 Tax=Microctonus hyperodae TaxID=165561 RepID=A0AA39FSH0_MICHY|nr:hypothetical protein PV327_008807 [Microctonus hyperodae]